MIRRLAVLVACLALAAPAAGMPVQRVVADSHRVLEQTLRMELPDRPVMVGDAQTMAECGGAPVPAGWGCGGLAYDDHVLLDRSLWEDIRAYRPARGIGTVPLDALYALAHEQLHTNQRNLTIEHGAIDSVLWDVWPSWTLAVLGESYGPAPYTPYPEAVAMARRASVLATGSPWRSRPARLWRRALLAGDDATREAMVAGAFTPTERSHP